MFDAHAHLCWKSFDKDREEVVERAREKIAGVIVSSARLEEGFCVLDLVKKHSGFLFASLGFHPTEGDELEKTIQLIKANKNDIVAVGEVGLDYHYCKDSKGREKQKEVFKRFISLAKEIGKPLVIHSWDAEEDAFSLVKDAGVAATFHCFTGSKELALKIVNAGFYVSISTNVLFSKKIRKTAKALPLDSLLLETDAPFLDPDRGRNVPWTILQSAEKIAELRGIAGEEVGKAALENAKKLFGI
ncbi:MAG: TatD family hydrolase [Candidatus Aenigmarchaeota archaeon]|nr:TatD family hydrolase [Candidatus Aenigmarchaeota archaeon]